MHQWVRRALCATCRQWRRSRASRWLRPGSLLTWKHKICPNLRPGSLLTLRPGSLLSDLEAWDLMVSSQQSSGSIFSQSKKPHFDPFYRLFGTSVNSDLANM